MSKEELGSVISIQLAEVAMEYWFEESKNPAVVNKILKDLKIPENCSSVVCLHEMKLKNMSFNKRADIWLSDIQKV